MVPLPEISQRHSDSKARVVAVVVSYHPEPHVLARTVSATRNQVAELLVIDNGSPEDSLRVAGQDKVTIIRLERNLGVGAAQNVGIREATRRGCTHVLLLDQDSFPSPNMVEELLRATRVVASYGIPCAAVGPQWTNALSGEERPFSPCVGIKMRAPRSMESEDIIECDSIISAGALVPAEAFEAVGLLDEGLFIDLVDTEWCLRARSRGFSVFGVKSARLSQSLGQFPTRIWLLRWMPVIVHKPFRYYYMFRNSLLLQRRDYVDGSWKRCNFVLLCILLVLHGLLVAPRRSNLRMMWNGLRDGWRGLAGPLAAPHN